MSRWVPKVSREDLTRERLRKLEPTDPADIGYKKNIDVLLGLLRAADRMDLIRLHPARQEGPGDPAARFHEYRIVHRTPVAADQRAALVTSLARELHWFMDYRGQCFKPRHGLRAVVGADALDLLLCFECSRVRWWWGDKDGGEVVVLGRTWPFADRLLAAADQRKK